MGVFTGAYDPTFTSKFRGGSGELCLSLYDPKSNFSHPRWFSRAKSIGQAKHFMHLKNFFDFIFHIQIAYSLWIKLKKINVQKYTFKLVSCVF